MTLSFQHNGINFNFEVVPPSRRQREEQAANIQPDRSLWTSRNKKYALNVEADPEEVAHVGGSCRHHHYPKPKPGDLEW